MLNGRSCNTYGAPEWRRLVALVPAEPRWWHAEVGAHLPDDYDREQARELIEGCGFAVDVLTWSVSRLSTGEKQRLAVVRALIRQPSALLLDETGSALDERNGRLLEEVIGSYRERRQVPVLWVSHDSEQLQRVATRRLVVFRDHLDVEIFVGR